MKFTSKDLLKAMGLKVGQTILIKAPIFNEFIVETNNNGDCFLKEIDSGYEWSLIEIQYYEYEIIQPKPILTEDEKNKLKDLLDRDFKWISRDNVCIPLFASSLKPEKSEHFVKYGNGCAIPKRMFEFIEPMETYSIKELLEGN